MQNAAEASGYLRRVCATMEACDGAVRIPNMLPNLDTCESACDIPSLSADIRQCGQDFVDNPRHVMNFNSRPVFYVSSIQRALDYVRHSSAVVLRLTSLTAL